MSSDRRIRLELPYKSYSSFTQVRTTDLPRLQPNAGNSMFCSSQLRGGASNVQVSVQAVDECLALKGPAV